MFVENIKYIQDAEKKAADILETSMQDGKNLIKKADEERAKLELDLKTRLQQYYDNKFEKASKKAEEKISELNGENDKLKEAIQKDALSLLDETTDFVYQKLLLI
ncbi:MAG: hypothetical protein KKH98_00050 [Spirochaetes bacterium]|nr:hypothetical protein [Spirochaetota bacterium]